ncbi:MAG: hypothetical protein EAZ33_14655 [Oscillatoriales cyanobacterium]|nr:MAG: hypothetical protein EAZ33_14655 [Oscillatoriales cyanobacterium]TAG59455.1 MAG: hypothetical protein EAZ28_11205 [Oscillatoriales cyanobacterium]
MLPRESIEKLYKAAACGDEQAVRLLIERVALSQKQIAAALTKLVDNQYFGQFFNGSVSVTA